MRRTRTKRRENKGGRVVVSFVDDQNTLGKQDPPVSVASSFLGRRAHADAELPHPYPLPPLSSWRAML